MPIVLSAKQQGLGEGNDGFVDVTSDTSIPRGIESYLQFKDLTLNDTGVIDKYRIRSIDGLDDADIRDSREEKPSLHGENPLNALYGGRTIAINGRIEAYTLGKLRDMQLALRTAFAGLEEENLYFVTEAPEKDHYLTCRKFSKLQWADEQQHATAFFRDFLITLRASDPRFYLRRGNTHVFYTNQVLNGGFETNDNEWAVWNPSSGFSSITSDPQTGWASVGIKAERITGTKDSNSTPRELGISTTNITDTVIVPDEEYIVRADFNLLNLGSGGYVEVLWYDSGSSAISNDSENLINQTGEQSVQFDVTAPANAAYARVRVALTSSTSADIVDYYVDNVWLARKGTTSAAGEIHLPNVGNIETFPRIFLYGPLTNISFSILSENGGEQTFSLEPDIVIPGSGQYYEIRSETRQLLRSDNENKISEMDIDSDWPVLYPGDNIFKVNAAETISNTSGQGRVEIFYRDAFI